MLLNVLQKITKGKHFRAHDRLFAAIAVAVLAFIGFVMFQAFTSPPGGPLAATVSDEIQASAEATLPQFTQKASGQKTFIADGMTPPTSQWFSSLAFKQPSDAVFAYPLAMQTTQNGFGFNHPQIVSSANNIFGAYSADMLADMGTVDTKVVNNDDLSVVLEASSMGQPVAQYRFTQGSPIIYIKLKAGNQITWSSPQQALAFSNKSSHYTADVGTKRYLITHASGAKAAINGAKLTVTATADTKVAVALLPAKNTATGPFLTAMQDPIIKTSVNYGATDKSVKTVFTLTTESGKGSLLALLPAQQNGETPEGSLGTYTTILGVQKLHKFSTYSFSNAYTEPRTDLDASQLSSDERAEVVAALKTDINTLQDKGFTAEDTYYGGKQLARAANLMQLARALDEPELAQSVYNLLEGQMKQWLNPDSAGRTTKYFYYDTAFKGLVGEKTSFGSDVFNDHHFHYGYFLYAAGYMADFHPEFGKAHAPVINAVARDIANGNRKDPYFPYMRPFDQYTGHSWASGISPFNDGNNNESSSEAVNAWYGLYLWAKASNNDALKTQAQWMYGRESNAALTYWTNFDRSQPQFKNYKPSVVSIVWGGKMDYGTWFSPSSYAKVGIQVIPVTPASEYLGQDSDRVATNLNNLNDGSKPLFRDILTMYKSFSDPEGAAADAKALPVDQLDDGNSRSWLLAWVYTHN